MILLFIRLQIKVTIALKMLHHLSVFQRKSLHRYLYNSLYVTDLWLFNYCCKLFYWLALKVYNNKDISSSAEPKAVQLLNSKLKTLTLRHLSSRDPNSTFSEVFIQWLKAILLMPWLLICVCVCVCVCIWPLMLTGKCTVCVWVVTHMAGIQRHRGAWNFHRPPTNLNVSTSSMSSVVQSLQGNSTEVNLYFTTSTLLMHLVHFEISAL